MVQSNLQKTDGTRTRKTRNERSGKGEERTGNKTASSEIHHRWLENLPQDVNILKSRSHPMVPYSVISDRNIARKKLKRQVRLSDIVHGALASLLCWYPSRRERVADGVSNGLSMEEHEDAVNHPALLVPFLFLLYFGNPSRSLERACNFKR